MGWVLLIIGCLGVAGALTNKYAATHRAARTVLIFFSTAACGFGLSLIAHPITPRVHHAPARPGPTATAPVPAPRPAPAPHPTPAPPPAPSPPPAAPAETATQPTSATVTSPQSDVPSRGRRQGCLAVANRTGQTITVYVQGSSRDGAWQLGHGARGVLADHTTHEQVIVDEKTVLWATSASGPHPRLSLLDDPTTVYAKTGREGCRNGAWQKVFE